MSTAGVGYTYLTQHFAAGDTDLEPGQTLKQSYHQTGSPAGRWQGAGFVGLGVGAVEQLVLGAHVSERAMTAFFRDGNGSVTGAPLGRPYNRYGPPVQGGDDGRGAQRRPAVVGYDLELTVPKSVSVLWAAPTTGPDPPPTPHIGRLSARLGVVERCVIRTRVGEAGDGRSPH